MAYLFLVDDNPDLAVTTRLILAKADHRAEAFFSGREMLDRLSGLCRESAPLPDAILLDLQMPGLDGYEVLGLLRENTRTRSIPVIILSGGLQECEAGEIPGNVRAFVKKPFDPARLLKLIDQMVGAKASAGTGSPGILKFP